MNYKKIKALKSACVDLKIKTLGDLENFRKKFGIKNGNRLVERLQEESLRYHIKKHLECTTLEKWQ